MRKIFTSLLLIIVIGLSAQNEKYQIADGVITHQDLFNTSMVQGVNCFRIPAIVTAPNGDLIAAIDERVPNCGDLNRSGDINIVVRRSADNGKTWSAIETVVNFPLGLSASDPSMIVDRDTKEIILFYNYMDYEKERDIYYLHVVKSKDNGKTWSKPEDITKQIAKPEWHKDFKFITSGRGIQTRDGRLLHTLVNLSKGLFIFGSDDHGKTWYFIDTPIKPADESKIIELADGTWMVNARVNGAKLRYVHTSTDQGKSWTSKPEPALIDPSCNGSIIRYTAKADGFNKDRIIFSNAKMEKGRMNLNVRISYDEGKTWKKKILIEPKNTGYSDIVKISSKEIGVFYEADDYKEIRYTLKKW